MDMGMPPSTFLSELIEGLTLFFSIIEMVLLVTPARLASSRWDRPFSLRIDCSRSPTSNALASQDSDCVDSERYHGDSVQYLQHLGLNPVWQSDFWSRLPASAPGIEPWHATQVAEDLVGNGPGSHGDVAGEDVFTPQFD